MRNQEYKNHSRYVFGFHIITGGFIVALLIGSIINLVHAAESNLYSASLICVIAIILGLLFWYTRTFALKAQDRAIRAEENLRHLALTGKLLDARLHINQVIALRFAPDDEFVDLARKAAETGMRSAHIKQEIRNWRADHHRV